MIGRHTEFVFCVIYIYLQDTFSDGVIWRHLQCTIALLLALYYESLYIKLNTYIQFPFLNFERNPCDLSSADWCNLLLFQHGRRASFVPSSGP